MINFKLALEKNIPGAMINGNQLNYPNKPFRNDRKQSSQLGKTEPDQEDIHLAYQSFKPGLDENTRFGMQDGSTFYRTKYSQSSYQTRLSSFQTRLKSAHSR